MSDLRLVLVSTPAELDRFIRVPMRLSANDPNYIAPLIIERGESLSGEDQSLLRACRGPDVAGGEAMAATSAASAPRSTS
jgi:hypothetical protein